MCLNLKKASVLLITKSSLYLHCSTTTARGFNIKNKIEERFQWEWEGIVCFLINAQITTSGYLQLLQPHSVSNLY